MGNKNLLIVSGQMVQKIRVASMLQRKDYINDQLNAVLVLSDLSAIDIMDSRQRNVR
jgi:hypothetical protein